MPTYQFLNKNNGTIEEHRMSFTVLDQFKADHPELERYFSPENLPIMSDGSRLSVPGIGRGDSAFEKGVIQRIKETVPGNTLGQTHKTKSNKEW